MFCNGKRNLQFFVPSKKQCYKQVFTTSQQRNSTFLGKVGTEFVNPKYHGLCLKPDFNGTFVALGDKGSQIESDGSIQIWIPISSSEFSPIQTTITIWMYFFIKLKIHINQTFVVYFNPAKAGNSWSKYATTIFHFTDRKMVA